MVIRGICQGPVIASGMSMAESQCPSKRLQVDQAPPCSAPTKSECTAGYQTKQDVMADMPGFNAKLWSQNLFAVLDRNRDMAACRKLKQDIEQTLKKVADGILLCNEFNKKMEESQVCMPERPEGLSLQRPYNPERQLLYMHDPSRLPCGR